MADQPELKVFIPEHFREPKDVDTFRYWNSKEKFGIDVGKWSEGSIDLVASICLSPTDTLRFLQNLLVAMKQYETEYGYDFGIFSSQTVAATTESKSEKILVEE